MKRIIIDATKCSGCKNCAAACMKAHAPEGVEFSLSDPQFESRNVILKDSKNKSKPLFCRHCDKPSCVYSCMSGAMTKDSVSGVVLYNKDKCASCFMCVMNCPFGVLKPDRVTKSYVIKCDFCLNAGGEPNCVKKCPVKTIYVREGI